MMLSRKYVTLQIRIMEYVLVRFSLDTFYRHFRQFINKLLNVCNEQHIFGVINYQFFSDNYWTTSKKMVLRNDMNKCFRKSFLGC